MFENKMRRRVKVLVWCMASVIHRQRETWKSTVDKNDLVTIIPTYYTKRNNTQDYIHPKPLYYSIHNKNKTMLVSTRSS